jgi:hypothetical protein
MRWKRGNRLKLVSEQEASASTLQIFDEVRQVFGVPVVPFLYRAYAAFPAFLELHWQAFRATVESRQFFSLGARLHAESYTRAHNYFEIQDLTSAFPPLRPRLEAGACLSITQVLDYYQYLDPLLLLIAAAQMQALETPIGVPSELEPALHPTFPIAPLLVTEEQASAAILRIWEERRRLVSVAFLSDEHRALAAYPSIYQEYWRALRGLIASPLYNDCQYRISESAWGLVREMPARIDTSIELLFERGLSEEDVSSLAHIHESIVHALSGLLLDVIFARIGCEGGSRRGGGSNGNANGSNTQAESAPRVA